MEPCSQTGVEVLPDKQLCVWHALFGAFRHDLDSWEHFGTVSGFGFSVWCLICGFSGSVLGAEGFGFDV